ncbi:MAG: hypothetical protein ACI9JR_002745, partial [Gammaproteobacteria bacterium]
MAILIFEILFNGVTMYNRPEIRLALDTFGVVL